VRALDDDMNDMIQHFVIIIIMIISI
jgi:hypothetical protein